MTASVPPSNPTTIEHGADSTPSQRGLLILFEGLDRSGKSTQARQLSIENTYIKFPGKIVPTAEANLATRPNFMTVRGRILNDTLVDRSTNIGQLLDRFLRNEIELEDHAAHLLFVANRWELRYYASDKFYSRIHLIIVQRKA